MAQRRSKRIIHIHEKRSGSNLRNKETLRQKLREVTEHYTFVNQAFAEGRYGTDTHASVKMWLSGTAGLISVLRWTQGAATFYDAFEPLDPQYINRMLGRKMPWWDPEEDALPGGESLHFEDEITGPRRIRPEGDAKDLLQRANDVHRKIYRINMFHPGKWHPTYQGRIHRWLVFVENTIRCLDWVVNNRDEATTFYMVNQNSMDEVDKAEGQVRAYGIGALAALKNAIPEPDHHLKDF